MSSITTTYAEVRKETLRRCAPLTLEDHTVQVATFASPPKWHLGHTTWFFETFVLEPYAKDYRVYNDRYRYLFNSYYNHAGRRIDRASRGLLTRPSLQDVLDYRQYVDQAVLRLLEGSDDPTVTARVTLGLQHEQQHQELLLTDIKYMLWHNPLLPSYKLDWCEPDISSEHDHPVRINEGIYEIGYEGDGFCFDIELGRHKVYLHESEMDVDLVTNGAYLDFIQDGGYDNFDLWHDEGWAWRQNEGIQAPLYWQAEDGTWREYTLRGLHDLDLSAPVAHISYYEAAAYAMWSGRRLPTEAEWEVASGQINYGRRWEWTGSAFLPYPRFNKVEGAIGEYNGKFMINQMVLRGASCATPEGHSRTTYRNFFHSDVRWQFSGIRLACDL